MKLYEIDQAIMALVDPETGEVTDMDALLDLQMAREEKIENLCLWYKDLSAEAKALKEEADNLNNRRIVTERKADRLADTIKYLLNGEKFKTARCVVNFRKSSKVQVSPEFVEWAETHDDSLLTFKAPTPSLSAIKDAIKAGREIRYAEIVDSQSMSIK